MSNNGFYYSNSNYNKTVDQYEGIECPNCADGDPDYENPIMTAKKNRGDIMLSCDCGYTETR